VIVLAHFSAQNFEQRGLATADGTTNANANRSGHD
jgi:hypothetical protein